MYNELPYSRRPVLNVKIQLAIFFRKWDLSLWLYFKEAAIITVTCFSILLILKLLGIHIWN